MEHKFPDDAANADAQDGRASPEPTLPPLPSVANRVIRVFISSTFRDMQEERGALLDPLKERIEATGVRVIGSLDQLRERLTGPEAIDHEAIAALPMDAAVASTVGALGPSEPAPPSTPKVLGRLRAR